MNLPPFVHLRPPDLRVAAAMLAELPEARALAGGTDLLVRMKQRRLVPRYLVNLKGISALDVIRREPDGSLRIGALTTLEALRTSLEVKAGYPLLHDAVSRMGTLAIRHCGTIGGNLCNASPAAETVPPLAALGAVLELVSASAERSVPLEDFLLGRGRTALGPGELLAAIRVPPASPGASGAYDKYSLRRMDLAIVGAAALLDMDGSVCRAARIVLSAVGPTALRARCAEAMLLGRTVDRTAIRDAARAAAEEIRPMADLQGTVEQKRVMASALTARVLERALERAGVRLTGGER